MKILGRIFGLMAIAASLLTACEQTELKEPVKIRLNKELISGLQAGQTQKLEVSVTPKDAKVTLVWASDNEAVAVVDDEGNVTGVAPGTAEVSVTADEAVAKCKVIVLPVKAQGLTLDVDAFDIEIGQSRQLEAVLAPEGAVADDIQWSSSKESVAKVKDGLVTAVSEGKSVITVTCNGGKLAAECEVTVVKQAEEKVMVTSIRMLSELELNVGAYSVLSVSVLPENADDKTVTFSVEGDCVSVDQTGKVEALKEGNAVVTATANDGSGVKAQCSITVKRPSAEGVKSVVIRAEGNASDVQVGLGLQLYIECLPEGAVPNAVSWTVDNQSLAQVEQTGVVTGVDAVKGSDNTWSKVVVSVNADGVTANIALSVIPRQPESIEVDLPENNELKVGQAWNFNPRVLPEGLGYSVFCSIMMPGNNFTASEVVSSPAPGAMNAQFAVADNQNLVYRSYRKDVTINVYPYWVESISLPQAQETSVGMTLNLNPVFTSDVEGVQPTYKDVKWSSSNPSVAKVDERTGEITALAAGVATITVTTAHDWSVPSGSAHKSAACELTVKAEDGGLNIGDFYYSDGTWSSELDPSKTVIGVVFAKADASTSDPLLARDYPGCTHGLVISTVEYAQQAFGTVSCYNGHGYYAGLGYDAASIVDVDKPNGYGNTLAHAALNASKPDYCTLFNSADGVLAQHDVAVPSTASAWYVPSYKEMSMINASRDVINASLQTAGGQKIADPYEKEESFDENRSSDWYWTSTIYGKWYASGGTYDHYTYAFDISKGAWTTSQLTNAKCKVRVILAF